MERIDTDYKNDEFRKRRLKFKFKMRRPCRAPLKLLFEEVAYSNLKPEFVFPVYFNYFRLILLNDFFTSWRNGNFYIVLITCFLAQLRLQWCSDFYKVISSKKVMVIKCFARVTLTVDWQLKPDRYEIGSARPPNQESQNSKRRVKVDWAVKLRKLIPFKFHFHTA